jgi:PhoPQ-activated pathogenicity-related protein|tara:strand:- start:90 stop:353 length:264 start_codon:yes stop_codon:yes gene_type:complete
VKVRRQSFNDFGKYLDEAIEKQMPENRFKYYGKIVKKLGLHRRAEIKEFVSMTKVIMQNQVAAYYEPESEAFYVVMQDLPEQVLERL